MPCISTPGVDVKSISYKYISAAYNINLKHWSQEKERKVIVRIFFRGKIALVSIGHLQRVRHANRGRLLLRTPGPVPRWDLQVF